MLPLYLFSAAKAIAKKTPNMKYVLKVNDATDFFCRISELLNKIIFILPVFVLIFILYKKTY